MSQNPSRLRIATFNVAMSYSQPDQLSSLLEQEHQPRFSRLAAIIQHVRPDILLLCEFDHPGEGGDNGCVARFCQHYLQQPQYQQQAIDYPFHYAAPSNTGLLSAVDLDGDGIRTLPNDGLGFGEHHGQYGMVLLSRYPILNDEIQTWQKLLWRDLPDNLLPRDYYSSEAQAHLRLSSKNHMLVPIKVEGKVVHCLCSHPTPPIFDGEEKRNAKRNHDELVLIQRILDADQTVLDDDGKPSQLNGDAEVMILGDLNADPLDGDGVLHGINSLLRHPKLNHSVSLGRRRANSLGAHYVRPRESRKGKGRYWTHLNGLRLDYALPSKTCQVIDSGVFWPDKKDPMYSLICNSVGKVTANASSDHRLVWVDISL